MSAEENPRALAVVRAVAELDPIYEYGCGNVGCFFCGADAHSMAVDNNMRYEQSVQHEVDCAWLVAQEITGQAKR